MGRHAKSTAGAGRAVAVLAAVVAVLGGGGLAVWAATSDGDRVDATAATSSSGPREVAARTPAPARPSSGPASASPDPDQAVTGCRELVRAGEAMASAAAASAGDWGMHTGAQRKLDAGEYTVGQTTADWAESKARGAADLDGFVAATTDWTATQGGCDDVVAATAGGAQAELGRACAARAEALAKVAATGTAVNREWDEHVDMMATKDNADPSAYHQRWLGMVADSQGALDAYAAAVAVAKDAPDC